MEALIFAAPEPIDAKGLSKAFESVSEEEVADYVKQLNYEYENQDHAFRIIHGAGGYRYATLPEYGRWVKRFVYGSGRIRLSRAALETVSLIAYRQPISRADIEAIRGVDVAGILRMLIERKLIQIKGRSSEHGRALLYVTTDEFLRHFGLNSLDDLPSPHELLEKNAIQLEEKAEKVEEAQASLTLQNEEKNGV